MGLSKQRMVTMTLDKVGDVHGHLVNLGVVELLDVFQVASVILRDKVDGDTFTTESTTASNPSEKYKTNKKRK